MKSQERADHVFRNTCNKSSAKFQYSFGKQQRFNQRLLRSQIIDKFYDLPSQISKRGVAFSKQIRDCDKKQSSIGATPWNYNPKQPKSTTNILFAPGRDKCKVASMFYNTTVTYPGPGNYNPDKPKSKTFIHMAGRPSSSYSTISPGPKYNFQSTLLDRNKILSKQKRKGSCRFVMPTNKSRLVSSQSLDNKLLNISSSGTNGVLTNKGGKKIGLSGSNIILPRQQRFKQDKNITPGPGQYQSFSQFIDSPKK